MKEAEIRKILVTELSSDKFGLFEKNLSFKYFDFLLKACSNLSVQQLHFFLEAFREKLVDIFTRCADIEAGDNLCLQAVQHFSQENLQSQLNKHHFCASSPTKISPGQSSIACQRRDSFLETLHEDTVINQTNIQLDNCPTLKLENIVNLTTCKEIWRKRSAVMRKVSDASVYTLGNHNDDNSASLSGMGQTSVKALQLYTTFGHPEYLAHAVCDELVMQSEMNMDCSFHWFASRDTKNIRKSLEGLLLLQGLFAIEDIHNPVRGKSTLMIALNMATFSGRSATNESISSLTRNGISSIMSPNSVLSEILYEDCANKLERRIRKSVSNTAIDNLQNPFSRLICGMPSNLGMTSFDLIVSCANRSF